MMTLDAMGTGGGMPVFAYIDPGTGSALVYVISGVIVSLYFAIRGLYLRLRELMARGGARYDRCCVAIHGEDPRYEITFLPVIHCLVKRGVDVTYFTMYDRDESFEPLPPGVKHRSIASGLVGYAYLNHLEAEILVTTTPQLDVMAFRRSPRVKHYCHLPHALSESRYARPYAYDFFDSVMCCGRIFEQNVRSMEEIRGLPKKRLFATGIPHYDVLVRERLPKSASSPHPVVLIAPSWGPMSIFEIFGTSLVKTVARHYAVIVRPHPQMQRSQPELYRDVLALEGVTVDTGRTPLAAMAAADILISDISGLVHEFAFVYEKPVIMIDHRRDVGGLEGHLLGGDSELKELCRDLIAPVSPSEMNNLPKLIAVAMEQHSSQRIGAVREDLVYNFGNAAPTAALQLQEILQCL
jgi:hypothetical protein